MVSDEYRYLIQQHEINIKLFSVFVVHAHTYNFDAVSGVLFEKKKKIVLASYAN